MFVISQLSSPGSVAGLLLLILVAVACGGGQQAEPMPSPTTGPSLSLSFECAVTEILPRETPILLARGQDPLPSGFDAVNSAECTFSEPVAEVTLELLRDGDVVYSQRVAVEPPDAKVGFPLSVADVDAGTDEQPLTTVIAMAKNNQIREIVIDGRKLTAFPRGTSSGSAEPITSRIGSDTDIITILVESGVEVGTPNGVEVTFKGSLPSNLALGSYDRRIEAASVGGSNAEVRFDANLVWVLDPQTVDIGSARNALIAARQAYVEAQELPYIGPAMLAFEPVAWNDTSLGCPIPGMAYAQVITPGFRFIFEYQGQQDEYHTDRDGSTVVACDTGAAS